MIRFLFKKLQDLLLPQRDISNGARDMTASDLLVSLFERISRLAEQLEAHADLAPYLQVAGRLRAMAHEKRSIANRLKEISDNAQGRSWGALDRPPDNGKNHWERLSRDLEDQRALDDFLARYQSTLIQQFPAVADLIERIAAIDEAHRRALLHMIAVADPQANQT